MDLMFIFHLVPKTGSIQLSNAAGFFFFVSSVSPYVKSPNVVISMITHIPELFHFKILMFQNL